MKNHTLLLRKVITSTALLALILLGSQFSLAEDLYLYNGTSTDIDYTVDGSVIIENANVAIYNPAHIQGAVITGSGAVVDIYGGQIDGELFISTSNIESLPEGVVTVYAKDFAVGDIPVEADTTELFLMGEVLSGTYENGVPFSFPVQCILQGGGSYLYYQTVKLGWVVSEPDIEVSQTEYNLGTIDVGSMQAVEVPVFNLGNAPLMIGSLQLEQAQTQFTLSPLEGLPAVLEPNSFVDLEISFSPVMEGIDTAVLSILSNDPNDPILDVVLTGKGILVELSPEEQIDQIQDNYNRAVEDGAIYGVGNGNSATNKVNTFGNMLAVADELIAAEMYESALLALQIIESKCDGQKSPADFIQGDAAAELNAWVNELIESLQ